MLSWQQFQCIDFCIGPVPIPFGNYHVFWPYWGMMLVDNPLTNNKAFLGLGWLQQMQKPIAGMSFWGLKI